MTKKKNQPADENTVEETVENNSDSNEVSVEHELSEMKDKYLRLYSEFENFRKRTSKERLDLIQTASSDVMISMLPILDDFERALQSIEKATDIVSVKEGVLLIHEKFQKTLENKGLKKMESYIGKELDPELHEAITQIPAPSDEMKGKIVDEIEKGYYLHDKIIRYSKVIIGQ